MILVLGPTAAGKTTFSRTLCKRFSKRGRGCFFTVSEPFGGLAYILVSFLSLIHRYVYKDAHLLFSRKKLAQLEIMNPRLLGKLLSLLVLLDFVSITMKYVLLRSLERIGFIVVVEDGAPQALIDHMVYVRLYAPSSASSRRLLSLESRITSAILRSRGSICVIIYSEPHKRIEKARKRGDGSLESIGFYNDVIRLSLPTKLCSLVRRGVAQVIKM